MYEPCLSVVGAAIPADYGDYSRCPCCSWLVARSSSSSIFLALLALPFPFLDGPVLKVGKSCIPALGTAPLSLFPLTTSNHDSLDFSPSFLRHSLSFQGTWPTHSLHFGLPCLIVRPCLDQSREVPHLGVHTIGSVLDATSPISIDR
jgi:hypothetical protein